VADARGPVWLVISGGDHVDRGRLRDMFEQRYTLVDERYFGLGTRVALFQPSQ